LKPECHELLTTFAFNVNLRRYDTGAQSPSLAAAAATASAAAVGRMEEAIRTLQTAAAGQGLSLVHYSAQLEPFLTQKHTLNAANTHYHPLNTL